MSFGWTMRALAPARIGARLLLVAVFGFMLAWMFPGIAAAHTELVSSDPAAGAELSSFPGSLTLEFSGPLLPSDAVLTAYDSGGNQLVLGAPVVEGSVVRAAITPPDQGGNIVVSYRVIAEDGHPAKGQVAFSVAISPPEAGGGADATGVESTGLADVSPSVGAVPADGAGQVPEHQGDAGAVSADGPVADANGGWESSSWIWWVVGAVVGLLAGAAAFLGAARHRQNVRRIDEEARAVTAGQRPELTR